MMLHLGRVSCIGDALRDTIVMHKSNVALIEADRHRENGRWSYRDLRREAERFGGLLQARGFAGGDRCAILMQNQARWLISATGAFWAGATVVPIDYKLSPAEQLVLLRHCRPRVLVTEYSTWNKLVEADDAATFDRMLVLVTDAPTAGDLGSAVAWGTSDGQPLRMISRARSDIACIVYSSGTGGTPKGCMLTHENYLAQAEILGNLFPIEPEDRYFSVLPTNHAIDFMVGYILPLLFGAAVVHQRTLRPQYLGPTMKRYGITHISLVPTILKTLERRIRDRLDDLPDWQRQVVDGLASLNELLTLRRPNHRVSRLLLAPVHDQLGGKLRLVFAGGAFIDRSTAEFFYRFGIPVVIGYGLTEASTVVSVNDLEPFRPETVGRPVPGVDVEIRHVNDAGIGEVWVRGPTVMEGYLDAPELTAEAIVDGWLRTGDLGVLDASGHLRLVGRVKNMIVTEGGKNIYPEDIEAAFDELADCEEHCVFAADYIWPQGKMTGERLVIVVRPKEGLRHATEAMIGQLHTRNQRLAEYKRISGYVVLAEEFPRTASLKIKRSVLADRLRELPREQVIVEL